MSAAGGARKELHEPLRDPHDPFVIHQHASPPQFCMGEDNLLAVRMRAFVVTTNSQHEFEVHLNLAGRMKLTGINQLSVADSTYIRLKWEFLYLAVILDAFSRKVVGRELGKTWAVRLALTALNRLW
jgi:putative transposase